MPLKLKVKRVLTARSERVKSVEIHPTQPWMLTSLYNGKVHVWNIESKQILRTLQVCDLPVRVARFIARKNWLVTGSDDTFIRVFNYNTLEHVTQFAAHLDFIRSIAVHPTRPFILSTGDDGIIRLWDWDKKWTCTQTFKGHNYLVMQIVINPKDNNQFATASLDKTVKVWQFGSPAPNFSLKHERDVNCLDYHPVGDKPYIVSGEDGGGIRIWDYQTKSCVQSLQVHCKDVQAVVFHPSLPIILSGSADGTICIWHSSTYRLENTLNYSLERAWAIACQKGSNNVALGFDEGSTIIRIGQEEPAVSMDSSGKIIWAKHSELQQVNMKAVGNQEVRDGERLSLAVKDIGTCEIYPQTILHSPNGRFAAVCGDGEYIIYTAMALRSKCYGSAQEFVWSSNPSIFAVRVGSTCVKILKNFKEYRSMKPSFGVKGIYGGHLLGLQSEKSLFFYDWESTKLIRKIEISPKHIFWNENGKLVCIASENTLHILEYKAEEVEKAKEETEDGIEEAFEVAKDLEETIRTGLWVGDCFIYTNRVNRLNYYVGGEIVTIAHLDRIMYLLGYIPRENHVYLGDKELNIVSYSLLLSVLEYQTAVMRQDFVAADQILPIVPMEQRTRISLFLEKQGFKTQALAVTTDPDHKFDLAVQLGDLKTAYSIAKHHESVDKWKRLSELAIKNSKFDLAQECLHRSNDFGGLMLLATCSGHRETMTKLAQETEQMGQNNVAFMSYFILGRIDECLEILIKTKRLPEAAFLARTYLPSQVSRVVSLWKHQVASENKRLSDALSNPAEYENLFPGFKNMLKTEQYLQQQRHSHLPAAAYPKVHGHLDRNPLEEMHLAEKNGRFTYTAAGKQSGEEEDDDSDGFVKVQDFTQKESSKSNTVASSNVKSSTSSCDPVASSLSSSAGTQQNIVVTVAHSETPNIQLSTKLESKILKELQHRETAKAGSRSHTENNSDYQKLILDIEKDLDLDAVDLEDFDMADLDDLDEEGLLDD